MKVLVAGNGFDLEHGLATSYWNCLDFLYVAYHCKYDDNFEYWRSILWRDLQRADKRLQGFSECQVNFLKNYLRQCTFPDISDFYYISYEDRRLNELLDECISNNLWLEYFWNVQKGQQVKGYKWIDFESEMSQIVQVIDCRIAELNDESIPQYGIDLRILHESDFKTHPNLAALWMKICSLPEIRFGRNASKRELKMKVIDSLYESLTKLTTAIEIYFKICTTKDIAFLENDAMKRWLIDISTGRGAIDKVISFNYTNTFVRYMRNPDQANICHIHGTIRDSITNTESPLIIGIDEYLDTNNQNKDVDWVMFKKYFQRLYKHSDYKYKGWELFGGSAKTAASEPIELYIFGHSLDLTDRDVLCDLILNGKQATTTIFYRSNEQLSSELKNLIRLIGSDELNKRARSIPPSIVFVSQY